MRQVYIKTVIWPTKGTFRISRSALTEISVVQVILFEDGVRGRGECRPYARYDETAESVTAQIETIRADLEAGLSIYDLQDTLPPGAARNAVDCALWDLSAKKTGNSVSELLGVLAPRPRTTAYTLSVDTPDAMANAAKEAAKYPFLKMKIGTDDPTLCIDAVITARPDAKLIIDANEALSKTELDALQDRLKSTRTIFIEQPLPAGNKETFEPKHLPLICADEALHTRADLERLWDTGYRAVNVKLDKCGGLTEGLEVMKAAKAKGFIIMAGCMVSSSLAMAPMMMLESFADVIDLDGPLLLSQDIERGLVYDGATIHPPSPELWG